MELDRYHYALRAVRDLDRWTGSRKMMHGETTWHNDYYDTLLAPVGRFLREFKTAGLMDWFDPATVARLRENYSLFHDQVHGALARTGDHLPFLIAQGDDDFGLDCPFIQIGRFVLEILQDFNRKESEWINRRSPEAEAEIERRARIIA